MLLCFARNVISENLSLHQPSLLTVDYYLERRTQWKKVPSIRECV